MPANSLKAYRFVSQDSGGHRERRTFYAESRQKATDMALRWGRRTHHTMYRVKAKRGI
jgi:hypothetical protein